jgi:hypothetical protein
LLNEKAVLLPVAPKKKIDQEERNNAGQQQVRASYLGIYVPTWVAV